MKTTIYFPIDIETDLEFDVNAHRQGDHTVYHPYAHNSYSRDINRFHDLIARTQKQFQLTTIAQTWFNGKTAFGFYCDIVHKARQQQPANSQLKSMSYVDQLEQAHIEVAAHISHALAYIPFLDDLLGRKMIHEGDTLYLPNVNYYSYQFYMSCTSAFEPLYTFWETLIVLPYNYDNLQLTGNTPSFGKYFREMSNCFQKQKPVLFSRASFNLKWLFDFFTGDYAEILGYRHRIVHHKFTPTHEGLLSAKYSTNAWEHIGDKGTLQKLNEEIKGMPLLLIKHFNYCLEGFKRIVYLIDELP